MPRKALDFDTVREIGAAMESVTALAGPRGTALKVHGRLLACTAIHRSAEPGTLMVRVSLDERDHLLRADPDIYYLTDHYLATPAILVRLSKTTRRGLESLLASARQYVISTAARARRAPPTARPGSPR